MGFGFEWDDGQVHVLADVGIDECIACELGDGFDGEECDWMVSVMEMSCDDVAVAAVVASAADDGDVCKCGFDGEIGENEFFDYFGSATSGIFHEGDARDAEGVDGEFIHVANLVACEVGHGLLRLGGDKGDCSEKKCDYLAKSMRERSCGVWRGCQNR